MSPSFAADDDPTTVDLLRRGDTVGVNQLESPAMRHLLIQMRPRGLGDVIQSLALIRPGAAGAGVKERFVRRRLDLEPTVPLHPRLTGLLGETKGLLLYEDDALRVLQALTGLDAPDADRFRKRVSKHKTPQEGEALRQEFLTLCARAGVPAEAVAELWTQLAKFNHYAFCKSHAVSYGLIAWDAAWLKAHHPAAFWTAALNNNQSAYPHRVYIEAIKRAGLEIRPPCIAHSEDIFTLEDGALRVGLGVHRRAAGGIASTAAGGPVSARALSRPGRPASSRGSRSGGAGAADPLRRPGHLWPTAPGAVP